MITISPPEIGLGPAGDEHDVRPPAGELPRDPHGGAAAALGLERSHLYKKLKALGIANPTTLLPWDRGEPSGRVGRLCDRRQGPALVHFGECGCRTAPISIGRLAR